MIDEIPILDLHDFIDESQDRRSNFVQNLGDAFEQIGFVSIRNHGFNETKREQLYEVVRKFFALPDEIKSRYEIPELFGQRGYVGKRKEHAKGRTTGDLKEFFHVGQENIPESIMEDFYPHNIWPKEVREFKKSTLDAFALLEQTGLTLLQAVALHLGIEENYFEQKVRSGNSILRPIHYFPITDQTDLENGAVRAAEHGDINLITLLMGASADGLEVLRRDNKWIPITALPDLLIVNVGDMLARLTNNKLKSTIHRVVNPMGENLNQSRYSIPFFMHPRAEMDLSCLPECISDTSPKSFEDISAGDYLDQRLKEIGLK